MHAIPHFMGCAALVALALAGCSAPSGPVAATVARVGADSPAAYDQLWEAVGDTLRDHDFRLDRQDRLVGVLSTHPETSAHFFELWRHQSSDPYYWTESNLHTIQRQATVMLKPVESEGGYELAVEVNRYRYSLEERQVDNSAGALRLFSAEAPTASGRMDRPSATADWMALGRDKPFEERLLTSILHRFAAQAAVIDARPAEAPPEPNAPATAPG